jgi:hypothetical protein
LTLSPDRVVGGTPVTGTVTLSAPAPDDGVTVMVGVEELAPFTAPERVRVPGGARSAAFTIDTRSVSASGAWKIYANYGFTQQSARLVVLAP